MKRAGFTMIELIFVIVILGILAAVAVPKLAATRADAAATKALADYSTALKDVEAYAIAKNAIPANIIDATTATATVTANAAGTGISIKSGTKVCADIARASDTNLTVSAGANIGDAECALVGSSYHTGNVSVGGTAVTR